MLTTSARAGVFEIDAEGSFFRFNSSTDSYTQTATYGGALAYHFFSITALELSFSRTIEHKVLQDISSSVRKYDTKTTFDVYSVSLVQYLLGRTYRLQPFIRAGVGYIVQKVGVTFTMSDGSVDNHPNQVSTKGMSANLGLGLRYAFTENFYLKLSGTVYATDLDKSDPLTHYTATAGLAVAF